MGAGSSAAQRKFAVGEKVSNLQIQEEEDEPEVVRVRPAQTLVVAVGPKRGMVEEVSWPEDPEEPKESKSFEPQLRVVQERPVAGRGSDKWQSDEVKSSWGPQRQCWPSDGSRATEATQDPLRDSASLRAASQEELTDRWGGGCGSTSVRKVQVSNGVTSASNVASNSSPDRGNLRPGQAVRIFGLDSNRRLNGEEGVLQTWDFEHGLWLIRLPSGEETRLRTENLIALATASSRTTAVAGASSGRSAGTAANVEDANKHLEGMLLQTNWSAIYQLFHQRLGVGMLERLERGYAVKAAVEMTLSIVSKCFALLRSDPSGRLHCTPLHIAALQSSTEAAEVIVREMPKLVEQTHKPSHTALCPLHIAILCGSQAIVELLLDGGASPNVRTLHDVCPLHLAATTSKDIVQLLLSFKADMTLRDVMGSSALHYAAAFKQQAAVEVLLGNAAQAPRIACEGDLKRVTPLHISCALYSSEEDLAAPLALLAAGAKPWQTDVSGASAREVVPWAPGSALQDFFSRCGDRAQSAAQQWMDEQSLGREAAQEAAMSEDGDTPPPSALVSPTVTASDSPRRRFAESKFQTQVSTSESNFSQSGPAAEVAALMAEVQRLKQELAESRQQQAALEKTSRQELEHSRQHVAMLEQAGKDQQRVFEGLQVLCENARSQHQAQLEEMQRRHTEERSELEERAALQLESARLTERDAATRRMQVQKQEAEVRIAELQAELEALSRRPPSPSPELKHSLDRKALLPELQKATEQLEELKSALRILSAKHSLPFREEACNGPEAFMHVDMLLSRYREESEACQEEKKALQDHLGRALDEVSSLRAARDEMERRCAELQMQRQEAENRLSAYSLKCEMQLKNLGLQSAQELEKARAEAETYLRRTEAAEERMTQMQPQVDRLTLQLRNLEALFQEEQMIRKKYHNQIQDMKGAIRVFCRFRPMVQREREVGDAVVVRKADAFTVEMGRSGPSGEPKSFHFDSVFEASSSQEEVFADCRELVQSAVDGYNVTIFAYGQTGAGKTHTMYGTPTDPGLAPRSIHALFDVIRREQQRGGKTFSVRTYMIEVYKQDIIDLLSDTVKGPKDKRSLEVKKDIGRGIMFVEGVTERQVSSPEELNALLAEGERKRHVTATKMNSSSSRSHLLLSIIIECTAKEKDEVMYGKITLCDLAGSERPKKSEVSGDALKEAIEINKSLTCLGDVIEALTKGNKSVPYRNHKLTMLMQDSIGGSAKTLMFVNCSPAGSNAEETVSSLKWATRARQVTNDVKRNADSKEVARLKQVIAMMSAAQSAQDAQAGSPSPGRRSRADQSPSDGD